jgi:hypothetical protein
MKAEPYTRVKGARPVEREVGYICNEQRLARQAAIARDMEAGYLSPARRGELFTNSIGGE